VRRCVLSDNMRGVEANSSCAPRALIALHEANGSSTFRQFCYSSLSCPQTTALGSVRLNGHRPALPSFDRLRCVCYKKLTNEFCL
jgi:hypothetical protein